MENLYKIVYGLSNSASDEYRFYVASKTIESAMKKATKHLSEEFEEHDYTIKSIREIGTIVL